MSLEPDAYVPVQMWERLGRYVGDTDEAFLQDCVDQATVLVEGYLGSKLGKVHGPVLDLAIIQTGSELHARKNAPSGVAQFATGSENPVRLARDPMTSTYPLLRRYVGWGIA